MLVIVSIVLAMTACGSQSSNTSQVSQAARAAKEVECSSAEVAVTVDIMRSSYQSSQISIAPGETVRWVNRDSYAHTVTSGSGGEGSGAFDSGRFGREDAYCLRFPQRGTVDYFCTVHSAEAMSGEVRIDS